MQFDYLKSVTGGLDRGAVLEELMDAYGNDVWNFAFFLTGRRELADDIAQDVFVKAFECLYSFRGDASVKTWLLSITRNKARDALRSSWLRRVSLVPAWLAGGAAQPSAEREALDKLVTDKLWVEVLALPRKLREVLLLSAHHGLKMKEIADLLGVTEGTVKSRLHRARAAISRKLEHDGKEGDAT